ncbi:hypothetical protein N9N67_06650 [Bacteriovoracaceae bacterium]|nr:hypothetical protein [Bacteriovoracaceae bacterium]
MNTKTNLTIILTFCIGALSHAKSFDPRCSEVSLDQKVTDEIKFTYQGSEKSESQTIIGKKDIGLYDEYFTQNSILEKYQQKISDAKSRRNYIDVSTNYQGTLVIYELIDQYYGYSKADCNPLIDQKRYDTIY